MPNGMYCSKTDEFNGSSTPNVSTLIQETSIVAQLNFHYESSILQVEAFSAEFSWSPPAKTAALAVNRQQRNGDFRPGSISAMVNQKLQITSFLIHLAIYLTSRLYDAICTNLASLLLLVGFVMLHARPMQQFLLLVFVRQDLLSNLHSIQLVRESEPTNK